MTFFQTRAADTCFFFSYFFFFTKILFRFVFARYYLGSVPASTGNICQANLRVELPSKLHSAARAFPTLFSSSFTHHPRPPLLTSFLPSLRTRECVCRPRPILDFYVCTSSVYQPAAAHRVRFPCEHFPNKN